MSQHIAGHRRRLRNMDTVHRPAPSQTGADQARRADRQPRSAGIIFRLPSHTFTDCRSPEGEAVSLIDSAAIALRLASRMNTEHPAVREALRDMLGDPEVHGLLERAREQAEERNRMIRRLAAGMDLPAGLLLIPSTVQAERFPSPTDQLLILAGDEAEARIWADLAGLDASRWKYVRNWNDVQNLSEPLYARTGTWWTRPDIAALMGHLDIAGAVEWGTSSSAEFMIGLVDAMTRPIDPDSGPPSCIVPITSSGTDG